MKGLIDRTSPEVATASTQNDTETGAKPKESVSKDKESVANDPVLWVCDKCTFQSKSETVLKEHIAVDHGDIKKTKIVYLCDLCEKLCHSQLEFKAHMKDKHRTQTSETCDVCNHRCNNKEELANHMRRHNKPETFTCDRCGQKLESLDELDKHISDKHPQKNNKSCDFCAYSSTNAVDLEKHLNLRHQIFKDSSSGRNQEFEQSSRHGERRGPHPYEERKKNGFCRDWNNSKCSFEFCKFLHENSPACLFQDSCKHFPTCRFFSQEASLSAATLSVQRRRLPTVPTKRTGRKKTLRRGRRKNKVKNEEKMYMLGTNSAGILNKEESFKRNISLFNPGVFFIQESHVPRKGKLKVNDYVIFESVCKNSGGGGLLTAVHKNLNPVSIGEETDDEVLVVQAQVLNKKVRFINGYGPQEDDTEKSKSFFAKLDEEIKSAKLAGDLVCIELDANSKLGPSIVPGDPKPQSRNGKLLSNVVDENCLVVVNGLGLCDGVITRERKTTQRTEKSVIDFFVVCERFLALIKSMKVDESRKHALTKYCTKKGVKSVKISDHNLLILELGIHWNSLNIENNRQEMFNFKDIENFHKFEMLTESDDELNVMMN